MQEEEKAADQSKPVSSTPVPGTPWYYFIALSLMHVLLLHKHAMPKNNIFITFCVRRSRGEIYISHGRLSVCPSPHSHTIAQI